MKLAILGLGAFLIFGCSAEKPIPFVENPGFEATWEKRASRTFMKYRVLTDGFSSKAIRTDRREEFTESIVTAQGDSLHVKRGSDQKIVQPSQLDYDYFQWWNVGRRELPRMRKVGTLDIVAGRKTIRYKTMEPLPQDVWLDAQSGVELKRMAPNIGFVHECKSIEYKSMEPSEFELESKGQYEL